MNVLSFVQFHHTPHLETDLELIQRHLDDGDDVTVVGCQGDLAACETNIVHDLTECLRCIDRRRNGLARLTPPVRMRPMTGLTAEDRAELRALERRFDSLDDLVRLRLDGFDIGYAVASSLVSEVRDPTPDMVEHRDLTARLLTAAHRVYRSTQHALDRGRFDRCYAFNGRWATLRGIYRACQSRGVDWYLHDRGSSPTRYDVVTCSSLHEIASWTTRLTEFWERSPHPPEERARLASMWFEDRRRGIEQAWTSYVKDQRPGDLPPGWRDDRRNIVLFVSSEDEVVAIGPEWKNPLYRDQNEGIDRVASFVGQQTCVHLTVRVHPNLAGLDNSQTRFLEQLAYPNLTIVPATSKVSSYELLDRADAVVTFGSTMGIEAIYWGKPSILCGRSIYQDLGSIYRPADHDQLTSWLSADLPTRDRQPARVYGYYFQLFGTEYHHFEPDGLFGGAFRGSPIPIRRATRLQVKLARFPGIRRITRDLGRRHVELLMRGLG